MSKRMIYGVITAQVSDIEQREILLGIIEMAQKSNIDIVVISNIYNPIEPSEVLKTENNIYNLILCDEFDGFIIISESIINPELQKLIINNIKQKTNIPVIAIGTPQENFTLPHFHFINTNDENDIENITDHLIDVHGFTNIHILTGHHFIDASHKRINGYKKSLEKHNILFNEKNVFFGDFWLNSGNAQAEKYINGELEFPQALICCNDYMAYGVLDTFMKYDIKIPDALTVTGYEYIHERRNHHPMLTTYQRNRRETGFEAVRLLTQKIQTGKYGDFKEPEGHMIFGDTCKCGAKNYDIKFEIDDLKNKAVYDFLNLFNQLEQRLTECCNIEEFILKCHDFKFMVRNAEKLYMCLYEDWYNDNINSKNIIRYNLISCEETAIFPKEQFSCLFHENAAAYYMCPLFFAERELGFILIKYNKPDTYDYVFRNFIKSISNNLEFLRMKNDIQYLLHCQNISENRDTLTNMLNEKGFKNTFDLSKNNNMCFIGLRLCFFEEKFSSVNENTKINTIKDIADCINKLCNNSDMCARIDKTTFFLLVNGCSSCEIFANALESIIFQNKKYMQYYGTDSFVCCSFICREMTYNQALNQCMTEFEKKMNIISSQRLTKHYQMLISLRTQIYMEPENTFNTEKIYEQYEGTLGNLRRIYKKCFGISFHQDCISARIAKAKYFLITTTLSIADIAYYCGYSDIKYFMRQFAQETGMRANQYRALFLSKILVQYD